MTKRGLIGSLGPLLMALGAYAQTTEVVVANFAKDDLTAWQSRSFQGETQYNIENDALCATAVDAASGLYREMAIDLSQTPILEWQWKVEDGIRPRREREKAGDDYPARVYVVFSGGLAFWRTHALNYVWSSSQAKGARWPNAFTANAKMIAIESGPELAGQWVTERRNVLKDYQTLFGRAPHAVDAIAIMTDTDNAGGRARACYRNIRFLSTRQLSK